MVPPRRASIGRQRIEIRRIESEDARQVCFSKRRAGLFNKASDLATLCGANVAAVVFSPAGKAFSFGHPSVDSVLDRFLAETPEAAAAAAAAAAEAAEAEAAAAAAAAAAVEAEATDGDGEKRPPTLAELNKQCAELRARLDMEKARKESLIERWAVLRAKNSRVAGWLEGDVNQMSEEDVADYRAALMNMLEVIKAQEDQVLRDALATRGSRAPPPSPLPFGGTGGGFSAAGLVAGGGFGAAGQPAGDGFGAAGQVAGGGFGAGQVAGGGFGAVQPAGGGYDATGQLASAAFFNMCQFSEFEIGQSSGSASGGGTQFGGAGFEIGQSSGSAYGSGMQMAPPLPPQQQQQMAFGSGWAFGGGGEEEDMEPDYGVPPGFFGPPAHWWIRPTDRDVDGHPL